MLISGLDGFIPPEGWVQRIRCIFQKYRLLKDKEGEYYLRAITSAEVYKDYNIRFSLFATILALRNVIKQTNHSFIVSRCEFSESFIRLYVEKDGGIKIPNIGTMSFNLEMSNDEIKREAFKFNGLFNISMSNKDGEQINIYCKNKRNKTKLVSIRHNLKPQTVFDNLKNLSNFIKEAELEMKEDLIGIGKLKSQISLNLN